MNNQKDSQCTILKADSLNDLLTQLEKLSTHCEAFETLLSLYKIQRDFPDMSHFRLGPNMFEHIPLYTIVLIDRSPTSQHGQLITHGMMTSILWNNSSDDLPQGWQGAVRKSYEDAIKQVKKDTAVGLYIRVEKEFKQQGWSEIIINTMKKFSVEQAYHSLIIPLRLPQRFEEQYAKIPYQKFITLKREDGQYMDHWLRLHTRLGGSIIGICMNSHQHAMNLNDFAKQFKTKKISRTGYYLSEKQGLWYRVYIDTKHEFALINQECTWIQHNLATPQPTV